MRRSLAVGEQIPAHHHREHQLVYAAGGLLAITAGAGTWMVPPQRAVWVPAYAEHRHRAWGKTDMRAVLFPVTVRAPFPAPAVIAVSGLLRQLLLALTQPGDRSEAECRRLRQVTLDETRRAPEQPILLPEPHDDRLRAVTRILREQPADPSTLAQLGRRVGASERTLTRLFQAETGMGFRQWRAQLRVHHALVSLAAGHSVTRTAVETGWSNVSAFIETFTGVTGQTPGRYAASLSGPRPGTDDTAPGTR
ncbi:AraC family transcriptional regulator [Streptomyces sp. 8L]|uniref:AraC family transcriptional regulator n=1 Tax=Streptomyces sp. 8L TaxID=2877242 RepID=UPI001CD7C6B7|nr:helix-turn-helix transcriptional regulator [Streptomyces sp. 8L]MCA1224025.1 helix-turn-helix transcriptional regulator [Streptomyces sp. 8L]